MKRKGGKRFIATALLASACVHSPHAQAAAISNLSDRPQTIRFSVWRAEREVTIQPGHTWRIAGRLTALYQGREIRIDDNEEYAIWKDGQIGPQRRFKRNRLF